MRTITEDNNAVKVKLASIIDSDPNSTSYYYDICLPGGETIGRAELHSGHDKSIEFHGNLGYFIKPAYRGHSFALAASRELIKIARDELGLDYINITCDTNNIPSIRTIEHLGAYYIGDLIRAVVVNPFIIREHRKHQFRLDLCSP